MPAGADPAPSVGLVIALPAEARSMGIRAAHTGDCTRWRGGWVAISGIGPHNAMRAAERLVAQGVVQLASWGVAGALQPDLMPGDVLVPNRIVYSTDDTGYATDETTSARLVAALKDRLRVRRGILWSTYEAIATRTEKHDIAERSHALAVDMEAAPVAAVAQRAGLPFVAVKVICDTAAHELPEGIARTLVDSDRGVSLRMLLSIAMGGPRTWRTTYVLAGDYARARHALKTAARLADPVAGPP